MLETELRPIMSSLQPFLIPNWDDEGAAGIGVTSLLSLVAVLSMLPNDMPRPLVTPNYDGSVGLFWDDKGTYLHVVWTELARPGFFTLFRPVYRCGPMPNLVPSRQRSSMLLSLLLQRFAPMRR